jgi:hypothetical protein
MDYHGLPDLLLQKIKRLIPKEKIKIKISQNFIQILKLDEDLYASINTRD